MQNPIEYPYLPNHCSIHYVAENHPHMMAARQLVHLSGCSKQPVVCVLVKEEEIIGYGANGFSQGHNLQDICKRVALGCKTGEGYEHCPQCVPEGHAEAMAIQDALSKKHSPSNSEVYLYGHWWVCQSCWELLNNYDIFSVYLQENSHIDFC